MIDVTAPNYQDESTRPELTDVTLYSTPTWQYFFDADMQEIIPGVYLGPNSSAQRHCLTNLLEKGVRYIICVREVGEAHYIRPQINDPSFTYLTLDIADNVTENIIRFFPKVKDFIEEAHARNLKVLVHGNKGNSRSATLVLAYVMEKYGLSSGDAMRFVKEKRASVDPNEGFRAQLIEYEPIYKARQTLKNGEPSLSNCRQKRKSEQLAEAVDYELIQPPPSPIVMDNNNQDVCQPMTDFSNHLYRLWCMKS